MAVCTTFMLEMRRSNVLVCLLFVYFSVFTALKSFVTNNIYELLRSFRVITLLALLLAYLDHGFIFQGERSRLGLSWGHVREHIYPFERNRRGQHYTSRRDLYVLVVRKKGLQLQAIPELRQTILELLVTTRPAGWFLRIKNVKFIICKREAGQGRAHTCT